MQSQAKTVDTYLKELPPFRREAITALCRLVRKNAPRAREVMAGGVQYELAGNVLFGVASQKHYLAFYCCRTEFVDAHRAALQHLDCGKCCIRFRTLAKMPTEIIAAIIRAAYQACLDEGPPPVSRRPKKPPKKAAAPQVARRAP